MTATKKIPTREFGRTGVVVGQVGFGCMSLAGMGKTPVEQKDVDIILQQCLSNGVNVWDTSDIYTKTETKELGYGEKQIGLFFDAHSNSRKSVFLCTKFALRFVNGERAIDNSAEWCKQACQDSLQRLNVDYIDLYYCHRYDGKTDPKETAKAMLDLKDAGKIKYVGVSEFPMEKLKEFNEVCHVDAIQNELSPWTPEVLKLGILDWCEENGTAYVAYSPLGKGMLTGGIKRPEDIDPMYRQLNSPRFAPENFHKNFEIVRKIECIAKKKGVSPGHVTLAWISRKSPMVLPIPGTSKLKNLRDNIIGAHTTLSNEEFALIDRIVESFNVQGSRYPGSSDNLSH